jgi:hypothetical protein
MGRSLLAAANEVKRFYALEYFFITAPGLLAHACWPNGSLMRV